MYKLTRHGHVIRLTDGAHTPLDEENRDYQEYLQWLSQEGNLPEEADPLPPPPPIRVSPWQMRKAINASGLRADVELAMQNSTDIEVKDGWEFATEFVENDPFVIGLGTALGKTEAELHALFELAASL